MSGTQSVAPCESTSRDIEYSMSAQGSPAEAGAHEAGFELRAATAADLPAIVALDRAAFAQPWPPQAFENSLADSKYIVLAALQDERMAGYGVAYMVGEEGEIATLAVKASVRGHGLGETILRALLNECAARGAAAVFLEVRAGNGAAQRLYARCGFDAVGRRKRYYADGEDAVIMKKVMGGE